MSVETEEKLRAWRGTNGCHKNLLAYVEESESIHWFDVASCVLRAGFITSDDQAPYDVLIESMVECAAMVAQARAFAATAGALGIDPDALADVVLDWADTSQDQMPGPLGFDGLRNEVQLATAEHLNYYRQEVQRLSDSHAGNRS